MRSTLALLLLLLVATPAQAILIRSGNGNTTAPPADDDPGWANVGKRGGLNAVYLGYGWVITAAHVGFVAGSTVEFDGVEYPIVADSRVLIQHDAAHLADLQAFRIDPYPEHLPLLQIRETTPPLDTQVILIGRGFGRGAFNAWGPGGWDWDPSNVAKRWGTNRIGGLYAGNPVPVNVVTATIGARRSQALVVEFNELSFFHPHEAMATMNDSGGALFARLGNQWELAGIQFAISNIPGQPTSASFYGNDTLSIDLAYYRDQILDVVRPCDDGRDNDGDGDIDYPADTGCLWEGDLSEAPACSDAIDNDGDGEIDYPGDTGCTSPTAAFEYGDRDGDGIRDEQDNCLLVPNPTQVDADLDGFGNICDMDFNGDGIVGGSDILTYNRGFGAKSGDSIFDARLDLDSDGSIGTVDFLLLLSGYGLPPGPSGLACAGTVPCPPAP